MFYQISFRPSKAGAVSQNSSRLLRSWPSVKGTSDFHRMVSWHNGWFFLICPEVGAGAEMQKTKKKWTIFSFKAVSGLWTFDISKIILGKKDTQGSIVINIDFEEINKYEKKKFYHFSRYCHTVINVLMHIMNTFIDLTINQMPPGLPNNMRSVFCVYLYDGDQQQYVQLLLSIRYWWNHCDNQFLLIWSTPNEHSLAFQ